MVSLGLVQAGPEPARTWTPAAEAYDTEFFRLKREFARRSYDEWLVLSAAHGLVEPDEVIERDEVDFADVKPAEGARWAMETVSELAALVRRNEFEEVAVLASRPVRETLVERGGLESRMAAAGARTVEPLAGLGDEDRQRNWLAEQLEIRRDAGE
ncbi:DUF6884 domain-containing protein [Halorarum salinum]|uniref:DUF6884 domain-containing protein n=1 Tax=Halorarum salinum TaxID=2743089 RepID=A0A7D5LB56_9EURY|nr:DUF6884 domain-containing protein [Halobaculum salinum]QLG62327.1 hypothetical protein HUG12_11545 [Halobaculum salinum]